jgi:hypothetical protein
LDVQRLAARCREASAVVGGRGAAAARDGELELALSTLPTFRAARAKTPQRQRRQHTRVVPLRLWGVRTRLD